MPVSRCLRALCLLALHAVCPAWAQEAAFTLVLGQDYRFSPGQLVVPANSSFRLAVRNESGDIERFGSDDLNVEQGALAGQAVEFLLGPLKPGEYNFFGFLHRQSAQAQIVVK